jgi:prepilin-type N-terminal cleavage/methylation domain-containing protein
MHALHAHRAGMTLVELLVVVAIIGLLAVTVLPNVANTTDSRRSREAARAVSSFIAKAQSRAIGRQEWSGCTIVPLGATGSQRVAAADIFLADVPVAYRGDTMNAALTISGTPSSAQRRLTATPANALQTAVVPPPFVQQFDLIRFDGRGLWYELSAPPAPSSLDIRLTGSDDALAEDLGYVARNTPWPAEAVPHTFEIMRQPVPSGSPLSLADGRVIDLEWSGFGTPGGAYRRFSTLVSTPGQRITLLFDGTGRLRRIIGSTRWMPTGPVFLLVGRVDRAEQGSAALNPADDSLGANWQYPDSYWIGIDIQSGVCKTAECKPNPVGANDLAKLIDSQTFIRQALLEGGR